MNTPITLKDLLIGLAIGFVLSLTLNLTRSTQEPNRLGELEDKVYTLERSLAKTEGENITYKRWIDSISPMLSQEQRLDLLRKM
jgi:hypothetical protein